MRIVIENLPHDVAEEEVRAALSPFAPMGRIALVKEGNRPTAVIETDACRGRLTGQADHRAHP